MNGRKRSVYLRFMVTSSIDRQLTPCIVIDGNLASLNLVMTTRGRQCDLDQQTSSHWHNHFHLLLAINNNSTMEKYQLSSLQFPFVPISGKRKNKTTESNQLNYSTRITAPSCNLLQLLLPPHLIEFGSFCTCHCHGRRVAPISDASHKTLSISP